MSLTTNIDKTDIGARLDRLERSVGRLIDVLAQNTIVARADALAGQTPQLGSVGDRLSEALMQISEPEVLGALTRIATLAPQLEAAAHAAAAAPELMDEALDVVRERLGTDSPNRMRALSDALTLLGNPEVTRAIAQLGAAAPALAGPLTAAAQATREVQDVRGARELEANVRELTRAVLDPDVTQTLIRLVGLLPQLEYAAFAAAAGPELLEEALELVRSKTANLQHDGVALERRLTTLLQTALKLSDPSLVTQTSDMLLRALPIVDKLTSVAPRTIESGIELLTLATQPELQSALTRLMKSLPSLSEALLALPTERATLEFLKNASEAVAASVQQESAPLGLFGALKALRDPHVQTALGFAVALARALGERIEDSAKPKPRQLAG